MKAAFPHVVQCSFPPRSTSYMQPCDVAVFRSFKSCIQAQASATLARSVIDGPFDDVVMNLAWRRSAEWARAVPELLRQKPGVGDWLASIACPQRRRFLRCCDGSPAALNARDEQFSKHIEPEPAPEDPVEWAMAEESDDEDDAPVPDAPLEPELIDMLAALACAPPMSHLERCIALRLVCGHLHLISASLGCFTCPLSRVSWSAPVFPCPNHQSQTVTNFFFLRWPQKVLTRGDFCAVP